jgi:hypothetical protein
MLRSTGFAAVPLRVTCRYEESTGEATEMSGSTAAVTRRPFRAV